MHFLIIGILLGWGAAIPIGPMNIEIIRRHLGIRPRCGIVFGLGACLADLTYLVLLSAGLLNFLMQPWILNSVGIIGSLILGWYGINALRLRRRSRLLGEETNQRLSLLQHGYQGYFMTLVNPYTIIFWSSVSSHIVLLSKNAQHAGAYAAVGIMIGTISWVLGLNAILALTRSRLPSSTMTWLNISGGFILLGFALAGILHVVLQ